MVGAVLLSTGLVVLTAPSASAESNGQGQETCDDLGYTKIDQASGSSSFAWGSLKWGGHTIDYTVAAGNTLALCAKSGTNLDEWSGLTGSGSVQVDVQQSISHIGYKVSKTSVTAVAPNVTLSNQCEVEGSYTIPNTAGVQYKLDGVNIAPGTYAGPKTGTITAVASGDAQLSNPGFSFALNVPAAADCPTPPGSTAVAPSVQQSTACGVQGSYTIPATTGVQYKLNGTNIAAGTYPGPASGTVTAVATGDHVLSNPAFSFALNLPAAAVCASSSPTPSPTVAPTQSVAPSQSVAPVVLGTESASPKPTKKPTKQPAENDEPVVLGTEAPVPTAVDAGLGSLPAAAPAPGSLLGQLLTAGGAMLMLAAGWLMMGRRQAGAREA